jgi:NAD(P)-dependent dehydrogenase (short-subunit alcohol dehydrogenase family)
MEADMTELLEGKTAIIYGGGGAIGSGVARSFAREGARVFLAGRKREALDAVAKDITAAGGSAEVTILDALDENAVDLHVQEVASKAGRIDVSFNLITRGDVQGIPLVDMTTDDLLRAVVTGLKSSFLTARAAGRQMIKQGSVADTLTREKLTAVAGANAPEPQAAIDMIAAASALRRAPRLADVADAAAFLASDRAAGITGSMVNVTSGLVLR